MAALFYFALLEQSIKPKADVREKLSDHLY